MAQIASLPHPPRVSQSLATITCSDCSQPLPLTELSDHQCPPLPSLSLHKKSKSPPPFFHQGLQNIVSNRVGSPASSRTPPPHAPLETEPDPFQRISPTVNYNTGIPTTSPTPHPQSILLNGGTSPGAHVRFAPSSTPTPPIAIRNRTPSNSVNTPKTSPGVLSFPHPERGSPQASSSMSATSRPRTPSTRRENSPAVPQVAIPSALVPRTRTPSNAPSHNSIHPPSLTPRPSFDRIRASTLAPRPSLDKRRPSFDTPSGPSSEQRRPSFDVPRHQHPPNMRRPSFDTPRHQHPTNVPRPSFDAPRPSTDRTQPDVGPASPLPEPVARPPRRTATIPLPSSVPFPLSAPASHSLSATRASVPDSELNIDTKCGGEAGMAGVGRRGFAAAARAAMFATPAYPHPGQDRDGKDGRRINAPKYLDINATMNHVLRAAMTPPLSPNSGYSHSPVSPHPVSPLSPVQNTTPTTGQFPIAPLSSPHDRASKQLHSPSPNQKLVSLSSSPADVHIVTPSRTPSPISNPFTRHLSGETVTQSPFSAVPVRLPFLNAFDKVPVNDGEDDSDEESVYTTHTADPGGHQRGDAGPMSPSTDSEQGLAYADDSDDDTPVIMPLDLRKSNMPSDTNKVTFPTVEGGSSSSIHKPPSRNPSASSAASYSTSRTAHAGPSRTRSASSATHTTTRSVGALERAMETLIEEGATVSVLASGSVLASLAGPSGRGTPGKPNRSNTVPGPVSPEHKPPKLPARSHTSPHHPHIHSERVGVTGEVARIRERGKKKKDRICARCDHKIEDGRWIQMDGGGVLCERCWKNMYLPKCRRCNLPIEKHAVSSSDGQLKGKYHRDCFNCHICQKPFPDKEFYVFDGKPLCAYHYHEANDSLCAAVSCGQPIEGPCAVTHAGKRYHPDHLLCEFENGCGERLAEYWEVDGQMFCEKHAALAGGSSASSRSDSPAPEEQGVRDEGRARKRMTRFIDLGGDAEDVDIR